ncbi:MAG: hypothetical protein VXZ62_00950, partial [Pseudomonadota bacterium]|nr:hypothetical protein [Pseudomonadota bacterium]
LKINGKLAKFGDPVFVDETGLPYPNVPLQTIDGRYFKSENVTHEQIKGQIKQVINKYASASDRAVQSQVDNYNFVLSVYGNTHELIPRLKKLNSLSPNKSSANTVGIMYSELSKLINTINSVVISQEQVAKRIYRNYKIVDMRQIRSYSFTSSYRDIAKHHYIYAPTMFNQARYIPVSSFADNPFFEAELPMGSEEYRTRTDERLENLKTELTDIVLGTRFGSNDDNVVTRINSLRVDLLNWMEKQGKLLTIENPSISESSKKTPHSKKKNKKKAKCLMMYNQDDYFRDDGKDDKTYKNAKNTAKLDRIRGMLKATWTSAFLDTHLWIGGGDMRNQESSAMWELVFPFNRTTPSDPLVTSGDEDEERYELHVGYDDRDQDMFYKNMFKALEMRPPVTVSYNEDSIISKNARYYAISYKNATSESFDDDIGDGMNWGEEGVDKIIDALLKRFGLAYDRTDDDPLDEPFERAQYYQTIQETIDRAIENSAGTLEYYLNQKIDAIRDSDTLLNSLRTYESRRAMATEIWNSFSNIYQNYEFFSAQFGNLFKAYIRTPWNIDMVNNLPANYFSGHSTYLDSYKDGDLTVYYTDYRGLRSFRDQVEYIKRIDITSDIVHTMIANLNAARSTAVAKIETILALLEQRDGTLLDAGVHDALANLDIIIEKSGFFFFDMEKFIRTRSFISRYIDVNKFMDFFPRAKDVFNRGIQVRKVRYRNINFETELALHAYDPTTQGLVFDVTKPNNMFFTTGLRPGSPLGTAPFAYHTTPQTEIGNGFDDYLVDMGDADSIFTEEPAGAGSAPTIYNTSSKLVQRNFSFPGFLNSDLTADGYGTERTWIDDYRLYLYTYNFYIDDDLYNTPISRPTITLHPTEENTTIDHVIYEINIEDNSMGILNGLLNKYQDVYDSFITDYYEPAVQQCSYNEYTQSFNNFFAAAILNDFPDGGPWVRMVSTYISYVNSFTDNFDDLIYADILETSENILETIRPETGTLQQLINFKDMAEEFLDRFKVVVNDASAFYNSGAGPDIFRYVKFEREIDKIEIPILDHIGNYQELSDIITS